MRRTMFLPFSFALAILTAVALLFAAYTTTGGVTASTTERDHTPLIARFYDALNTQAGSGGESELNAVLAPTFVDHVRRAGLPPTRDGLIRYLASVRNVFPALLFSVEEVV